jgi:uncharacterized protein
MDMEIATARDAVLFASEGASNPAGICFFGGEPLLRKDLIQAVVVFCRELHERNGRRFTHLITTNGLLLNEPFLEFANAAGLRVTMSHDGERASHDRHRADATGCGSWEMAEEKAELLLRHQPDASVMMVVSPDTLPHYSASVDHLAKKGFRSIVTSLDYAADWADVHLPELARQYRRLADWYEAMTLANMDFHLSPFEEKIASHVCGGNSRCARCHIGVRQLSVAPDGVLYPCVQFVKDGRSSLAYAIGDVWKGVDEVKRAALLAQSATSDPACDGCAIADRCNNDCGCLNWQATGTVNRVPPILCESEKLLTPVVDDLGARLYARGCRAFLAKHYAQKP